MVILGSTGSIGKNTLDICQRYGIQVEAISCNNNIELLNEQIAKFNPKFVCIGDEKLAKNIKHKNVFCGEEGIVDMLSECKSQKVVNALVGFAGLKPSFKIQEMGKTLALANKESLVIGGKFLKCDQILAIDSEHFGLKFLLSNSASKPQKLIITASGGAFYKIPVNELKDVKPEDALKHPTWSMGAKITIDSASMANKLFEVLEAYWLYGIKDIEAIIEKTSMIHALVEFKDGSTTAHISGTDMRLAIAHAVLDSVDEKIVSSVDLLKLNEIKFQEISLEKYPIFGLKDRVLQNPDLGVVINAANEVGVYAFLDRKCGFLDISKVIFECVDIFKDINISDRNDLFVIDDEVRKQAKKILGV
ncbi:1-deoxy-D-xylulose 5-phosphate reductoisomerase [Campylobacter pinnipediorum subsp. pinnipediorum]|uniref:1-deoxy-D-xylulose-5-phosphate reductoisomerase n=1 Tax=Campylobacter pinnipediorum TaxID=1965231 RepID=UPI000995914B|nr:1-deoxy-D-xylulose-5-phosphate reductoisomerase [Campylobacter pinnipediorum]AQW80513.1 1-deoxy-D-xylulose 5-phosphate reductoisomerase [Campylobacter pinnipediorum subsp. pinnipediorum]